MPSRTMIPAALAVSISQGRALTRDPVRPVLSVLSGIHGLSEDPDYVAGLPIRSLNEMLRAARAQINREAPQVRDYEIPAHLADKPFALDQEEKTTIIRDIQSKVGPTVEVTRLPFERPDEYIWGRKIERVGIRTVSAADGTHRLQFFEVSPAQLDGLHGASPDSEIFGLEGVDDGEGRPTDKQTQDHEPISIAEALQADTKVVDGQAWVRLPNSWGNQNDVVLPPPLTDADGRPQIRLVYRRDDEMPSRKFSAKEWLRGKALHVLWALQDKLDPQEDYEDE